MDCKYEFHSEWKVKDAAEIGFWYKTAELCLLFCDTRLASIHSPWRAQQGAAAYYCSFSVQPFQTWVSDP
jgi:hypothetical protein